MGSCFALKGWLTVDTRHLKAAAACTLGQLWTHSYAESYPCKHPCPLVSYITAFFFKGSRDLEEKCSGSV